MTSFGLLFVFLFFLENRVVFLNNKASGESSAVHSRKQSHCSSRGDETKKTVNNLWHSRDQLSYVQGRCALFYAHKRLFFGLQ